VTSLSTMEANFGSLFAASWSYIRDQYRRAMYTWIGALVEIVTFLLIIVVLPIWWGLYRILRGLRP
jgi:fumarate reductase subunit D